MSPNEQMHSLMRKPTILDQLAGGDWVFRIACIGIAFSIIVAIWLAVLGRRESRSLMFLVALMPLICGSIAILSAVESYDARLTGGTENELMTGHNEAIPRLGVALALPDSYYIGVFASLICLAAAGLRCLRDTRQPS